MLRKIVYSAVALIWLLPPLTATATSTATDIWRRPPVPAPDDNQPNAARVELGRALFFDPRLSAKGVMSCASCHNPALGWTDGRPTAVGHDMKILGRATPTIVNAAFNPLQMWDGRKVSLEAQALGFHAASRSNVGGWWWNSLNEVVWNNAWALASTTNGGIVGKAEAETICASTVVAMAD